MTKEQYETLLGVLADALKAKDGTISLQEWQINDLKKKLAEAEYHLDPTPDKAKKLEIR